MQNLTDVLGGCIFGGAGKHRGFPMTGCGHGLAMHRVGGGGGF